MLLLTAVPLGIVVNRNWPYRYRNVHPLLENVFASQVKIEKYHRTYFPRPGFVANGLTLRRKGSDPNAAPLGTADHLIVQGGWLDLLALRRRVELVDVVGLHLTVPPVGSEERRRDFPAGSSADFSGPETAISKLQVRDSVLEIQKQAGGSFKFPIHTLVVKGLEKGHALRYDVEMENAMPSGRIVAHGSFGPLLPANLGNTSLMGDFTFDDVQLHDIGTLQGVLKSQGHFERTLDSIDAHVTTESSDFAVGQGRSSVLTNTVHCTINGLNGDVILNAIEGRLGATPLSVSGSVTGSPKIARVELSVRSGRAQDLLRPFLHGPAPITGGVTLKAHAEILPGGKGVRFLHRLHVEGRFGVSDEKLTNAAEEQKLSAFSQRAQGEKKDEDEAADTLGSLSGPVTIREGILSTQGLRFAVPGASADLNGTYNFVSKDIRMTGNVRMDSDISHVTTGFKSMLLKPFAPLFERKHAGAVIPIAITGVPGHYSVSGNFLHTK
ncbi:MAG TPA: AsmA-like C-terminal region-containing protein [Acidobacteriaceae bacterium]